jgi:hypothetical protein
MINNYKMKTLNHFKLKLTVPFLLTVMVLCMGCPYESAYPLEGTRIKYDKDIIGSWHEGETDVKITRIDDYNFSFVYDDHDEEYGGGKLTGSGYFVTNNGATYVVIERNDLTYNKYVIYKVISIELNSMHVIPLDEDDISSSKTFGSAQEFTRYVLNSKSFFGYPNKMEYKRGPSSYIANNNSNNNSNTFDNGNSGAAAVANSAPSSGGGTTLFYEDFQSFKNNWYSNYDFKDSNYIYISTLENPSNHFYLFRNRKYNNGYIVPIPFYSIPSSNYSIEISTKHHDGVENSGYGIKFGGSGWQNVYSFNISADGYYRISKKQNGDYSELVPWTTSSALNKGYTALNRLEVRVYSNYSEFYINGQYIRRVDITPFGTTAGLEVYNNQTVDFDDLYIKTLGSSSGYNNNNSYSSGVLFTENFQTRTNNWYHNYDFKDSNYIYINTLDNPSNHCYLFRNRKNLGSYIVPVPYTLPSSSNYSFEVYAKHHDGVQDRAYGIKFGASDWDNCYSLNISANGYYRVSKMSSGRYSDVIPWTTSSALYTGNTTNKIEVRVYNSYVDIYINNTYVTRLNDFSSYGKYLGLEVYNNQTIYYDDLVIKKL